MACMPHCEDIYHRIGSPTEAPCPRCGGRWVVAMGQGEAFRPYPPIVREVTIPRLKPSRIRDKERHP